MVGENVKAEDKQLQVAAMQEVPTMCARKLGLLDDGGVQNAMESLHRIYFRRVPSISVVLKSLIPKMSDELGDWPGAPWGTKRKATKVEVHHSLPLG